MWDCSIEPIGFDAASMIESIKGYPLLSGARGRARVDTEGLIRAINGVAELAVTCPEITELDINPLIVNAEGCFVADVKIMI